MRSFISKNTELLPSSRAREAASAAPPQQQGLVRSRLLVNHPFLRFFLGGKPRGGGPCPQGLPADMNVPSAPVRGRGAVYEPRTPPETFTLSPRDPAPAPQRWQRPQPLHKGLARLRWDVLHPTHSCPFPLPPGPTGAGSSLFCPNPSQHIAAAGWVPMGMAQVWGHCAPRSSPQLLNQPKQAEKSWGFPGCSGLTSQQGGPSPVSLLEAEPCTWPC